MFSADSIGKSFGLRRVLSAASIWVKAGEITALLGRNGCGKSTLLKIAAGQMRADHGVVLFDGTAYLRPRLRQLAAKGLFYLPQRELLSRRMTIAENIRALEWRFGSAESEDVADRLGILHLLEQTPRELSGGEVRRAELAIALMRRPRVLLADEPFAGINPSDAEVVTQALRELAANGCGIIVTGHEVPSLMEVASDVVWMVGGTTHGLGSPASAKAHDQFRREYLGMAAAR
jgi:lipopolysaccharide export system ATP-binding protein